MRSPEKEKARLEKKEKKKLRRKIFWLIALGLLVLSPIDAVPDVIPVIGQIDDLLYIAGVVTEALLLIRNRNEQQKEVIVDVQ